jgi:hypothetical protein
MRFLSDYWEVVSGRFNSILTQMNGSVIPRWLSKREIPFCVDGA